MLSSRLFSICRPAFLSCSPTHHPPLPMLRTISRAVSSTTPRYLPLTSEVPKVANNMEGVDSQEQQWTLVSNMTSSKVLRQSPYSGRTVEVKNNQVSDSLRILDGILARNKVRFQLRMAERHEKKGYKRRRLESQRWRNQFASEVRKKVQLVVKMRDRGA